ncbi:hypothetical protein [Motilimonas cestriensis]|uniref:hypothetical protein n=1 Tax=Motilimonas cestriensis TaxID=2742685 RepID=UPI003DA479CC
MNIKLIAVCLSLSALVGCASTPPKKTVSDFMDKTVCDTHSIKQESGEIFADLSGDWSTRRYYDANGNECYRTDTAHADALIKLHKYNMGNKVNETSE